MTQRQASELSHVQLRAQMASLPRNQEPKSLSPLSQEGYPPYQHKPDWIKEMRVYERNSTGDLKFLQKIELDFLPDNPCTSPHPPPHVPDSSHHSWRRFTRHGLCQRENWHKSRP